MTLLVNVYSGPSQVTWFELTQSNLIMTNHWGFLGNGWRRPTH